jgi:hypothetical protein
VAKGAVVGVVAGVVLVAIIAGVAMTTAKPAQPVKSPTKKPPAGTKPTSTSSPAAPPGVTVGRENTSSTLTADENVSLANDSADLLFAWGMVSPHKVYVTAIANALAVKGDTRAQYVNQRLAIWSTAGVAYANLISPEADIVADPSKYTLDQISDAGGASGTDNFKLWAAEFLKANQRADDAEIILAQIAASKAPANG